MKLELENLKLDKINSDKTIENLRNFEVINKEQIKKLTKEKEEILSKNKIELELKLAKSNNENQSGEFICKFCKNRQNLNEPEFPIVNPGIKNKNL